jgi:alpha-D-xyloside xylohydrolase
VRYAEAATVPENATPMLIGAPPPPTRVSVEAGDDAVALATPSARLEVRLAPLSLRLLDGEGAVRTEIGGPEKNHFPVWDAYNTGVCRTREGRPLAVECFALDPQEGVFGFGEKFLALDAVGRTIDLNMVEAMGTTTPRSYKNVPLFWSPRGWGVFLHHSARITCWVGSRAAADLQVAVEDDFLDYYLFVGTPQGDPPPATPTSPARAHAAALELRLLAEQDLLRSADEALEVVRKNREARRSPPT